MHESTCLGWGRVGDTFPDRVLLSRSDLDENQTVPQVEILADDNMLDSDVDEGYVSDENQPDAGSAQLVILLSVDQ